MKCFAKSLKYNYLIEAIAISGESTLWRNYRDTNANKVVHVALALWMLFFSRKFSSTIIADKVINNSQSTDLLM